MSDTHDDFMTDIRRSLPDWMIGEQLSPVAKHLRREWTEIAADASLGDGRARLSAAMMLLKSERPRRPLLAQANARALRWANDVVRRSKDADRLRGVTPKLPLRTRIWFTFQRLTLPVAAAVVLAACKIGILQGFEFFGRTGDRLAEKLQSMRDSFTSV